MDIELPVVGYGRQSISSLIAIGTPSRAEIGTPIENHNDYNFETSNIFSRQTVHKKQLHLHTS